MGPLTYLVCFQTGKVWKSHIDHLKSYPKFSPVEETEDLSTIPDLTQFNSDGHNSKLQTSQEPANAEAESQEPQYLTQNSQLPLQHPNVFW